ncbi:MAG: DUF2157 domain-containing protein [Bacteroidota bacterium]
MSNSKHARWLLAELPGLLKDKVLDQESAHKLEAHYKPLALQKGNNPIFIITGILGALLIGAGIISIFAYNWDNFGRGLRAFLSVAPLLIAQGFYAYAYFKKKDSVAWIESTSGFLMLMLASSIALISQTYNIAGSMEEFLWIWMLLSIPIMYLRNSTLTTMMFLAGISAWTFHVPESSSHIVRYWLLLGAAIPHLWMNISHRDRRIRANLLGWTLGISLLFSMIRVPEWRVESGGIIAYAMVFGLLYLLGRRFFGKEEYPWQRPFQSIAIVGTYVMAMFFAFESMDFNLEWKEILAGEKYASWASWTNIGIFMSALAGVGGLLIYHLRKKNWLNYFIVGFPVLVIAYLLLGGTNTLSPKIFMILFNVFLLAFGAYYLREGINKERLGLVNAGMFIMSSLFVMRFFDPDFSFLVKGIAFLLIGSAFFGVNIYLMKKKK